MQRQSRPLLHQHDLRLQRFFSLQQLHVRQKGRLPGRVQRRQPVRQHALARLLEWLLLVLGIAVLQLKVMRLAKVFHSDSQDIIPLRQLNPNVSVHISLQEDAQRRLFLERPLRFLPGLRLLERKVPVQLGGLFGRPEVRLVFHSTSLLLSLDIVLLLPVLQNSSGQEAAE